MEDFKKKRKISLKYWLAMSAVIFCIGAGVYGLLGWIDQSSNGLDLEEDPKDFTNQVEEIYTWNLSDMYQDQPAAKLALEQLKKELDTFKGYEGKLKQAETFKEAMTLYSTLLINEEKLRVYANLNKDAQMDNDDMTDFLAEVEQFDVALSDGLAFFKSELAELSNKQLEQYLEFDSVKGYESLLEEVLYDKSSVRSETEDRLMGLLNELELSYENNYQAFWNRYEVSLKPIAYSNYYSKDDDKRFEATKFSMQKQIDAIEVLASNLEGKIKYDNLIAKAYEYDSDLEMVLDQDNLKISDYQAFEKVTDQNLALYHRWIAIKQKMLKLERPFQYHDEQLELISDKTEVKYEDAVKGAREAFKPLGTTYLDLFDEAVSNRWIDVYPRPSKYRGSYTWGAYLSHPYILLNYEDQFESALTFAHEIGHGIHTQLSAQNQPYSHYENSIFKAEIASTTNEVLYLEQQLKSKSGEAKKEVLIQYIDLIVGTVFEQMKASEFEKKIHEAQTSGKDLDGEFLNKTWSDLNQKYYGSHYQTTELDGYGWTGIDHLYWNFYMYKYATGLASGYAIASQLMTDSENMAPLYNTFLKSGNEMSISEELLKLHIDLKNGEVIEDCYQKLESLLNELETLL